MEAEFEREVLDRLIKIEGKLDGYNNAKIKTYENEKEILRIKAILKTSRRPSQISPNRINGFSELLWRLLSSRPSGF